MHNTDGMAKPAVRRRRAAFTLIELLVVIMIILLLLGTFLPTLNEIRLSFLVSRSRAVLALIEGGVMAYYADFDIYPPSGPAPAEGEAGARAGHYGAQWLTECLTGHLPDDGASGLGFRAKTPGPIRGPYNGTEKLKTTHQGASGASRAAFLDSFDNTILYYRYEKQGTMIGYVEGHNAGIVVHNEPDLTGGPNNLDGGYLHGPGGRYFRSDFVLITPGPNNQWDTLYSGGWTQSDDITNLLNE